MNPDGNAEDPARKETQEFDPALVDSEGIHPERGQDVESIVSEQQEQTEGAADEQPEHPRGAWHNFQTP